MNNSLLIGLILLLVLGGGYYYWGQRGDSPTSQVSDPLSQGVGTKLDLSNQGLTQVPGSTFNNTNLEELDLSHNALSGALQAEVRHLQNLRVLDLSNNNFTGVPAEVGQLQKLERLDLSNNQLTGLPYEIGNLQNLKVLNISGNDYSALDLAEIQKKLPATVEIIK